MRVKLLFFFIGLSTFSVLAQENLELETPARYITKIPFTQLTGGVIMIKAQFDTLKQPFNFILDTGSGAISLDSSTVAEFNIFNTSSGKSIRGLAGVMAVNHAQDHSLTFPGLKVDSLTFYINNYDLLSSVYGIKIDGIIGYSFLKRYIVKVSFDTLELEIFTPGKIKYPRGGTLFYPTFTALPGR